MANNQANIKAVITAEDRASGVLKGFGSQVDNLGSSIVAISKKATLALAAAAGGASLLGVRTAADLESARQGFVTLLGSAENADKTMQRIKKEAARTPFEIPGLTKATQLLTAVTKDGDRALDLILNVGEGLAAMGRGQEELDRIAVNLQQIAATGRAFGIDIRQFAFAGIPIYEMLQKEIGLTGEALQAFIEEGGVTFELLEKMFASASDEGGRWAGAFEKQAGTFNQLVSNMKDSFQIFAADFVKNTGLFDVAKTAIRGLTEIFNGNNQTLKQWGRNFSEVARAVGEYLGPKLQELWETLSTRLAPTLERLWKEILQPLAPIIGVVLVAAIGLAIDALNLMITILSGLTQIGLNVIRVFVDLGHQIAAAALTAYNGVAIAFRWIGDRINDVRNWFNSLPEFIKGAVSGIAEIIIRPFREAFEFIAAGIREVKEAVNSVTNAGGSLKSGVANQAQRVLDPFRLFHRASGGPVMAGVPYTVGEQGRETFIPSQNGTIIDANKSKGMTGGSTINLNVNVGMYAGTEIEKRKMAQTLLDAMRDLAGGNNMSLAELIK